MVVPDDIAQQLYDLELVVIQLSHDPRLPPLDQEPKLLFEVDRLSFHGHASWSCPFIDFHHGRSGRRDDADRPISTRRVTPWLPASGQKTCLGW